jgi:radical SAM PhpK family P-methyltransferase
MSQSLDCVVIGYKDRPPEARRLVAAGNDAATRDTLLQNVRYNGRLSNYLDFLSARRLRNEEWSHEAEYRHRYLTVNEMPTLAPVSLTSYLRQHGVDAEMVNYFDCEKPLLSELLTRSPTVVAITTTFYTDAMQPQEIVRWVRRRSPSTKIVMGGPFIRGRYLRNANDTLSELMPLLGADYYIVEEFGMKSLLALVESLKGGTDPGLVANICSRSSEGDGLHRRSLLRGPSKPNGYRHHGHQPEKFDLNKDTIDWDILSVSELAQTMNLVSAQSCPYKCSFCNHPVLGGDYKVTEVDVVERQLEQLHRRGRTNSVIFVDDTFNLPKRRFKEFCRMLIRRDFGFRWFSYLRVDDIDAEAAQLMRDSGCSGVCLGIESGDDVVLDAMYKQVTVDQYLRGMELLNTNDIWSFGNIIVGYPGETEQSVQNTIRFLEDGGVTFYRAGVWQADPSTPIFKRKDEFELEGAMFSWRHKSMNAAKATEMLEDMFKTVDGPTWCPIEGMGFWGIAYLLGKGMTLSQVKQFLRSANGIVSADLTLPAEAAEEARQMRIGEVDTLVDSLQLS